MKRLVAAMTVAVLGAGFAARSADVSPFQIEAELMYMNMTEEGGDMDMSVIGIGATYAFKSVDPGSNPIEEARFLARVPYAGLNIGFISGDATTPMGVADLSGTQFMINGGYADKTVPVAVNLGYSTTGIDGEVSGLTGTIDFSSLELLVGAFVMPNLVVGLTYETGSMEATYPGMGTMEEDESAIGLAAKWVQSLGTNGSAVNVEFGYSGRTVESPGEPDWEASIIEIGADYYINQFIGVGFGLELLSGDEANDDSTTFGLRASYNAGSKVGVRVAWEKTSYEPADAKDDDMFAISVVGRF